MKHEHVASLAQMKETLGQKVGSKFPLKMTLLNGEVIIRYVRGFADEQKNILLISENSYSLAMKILEVNAITILQFAEENATGEWKTLHGKWHGSSVKSVRELE